jgi:hypothetical protein
MQDVGTLRKRKRDNLLPSILTKSKVPRRRDVESAYKNKL